MCFQLSLINTDISVFFGDLLGEMYAEKALDVATGLGGFAGVLKTHLQGYGEIIGIDMSSEHLEQAREYHPDENISFRVMDAARMDFAEDSFDLVSCSFSLHHMDNIPAVLAEIRRVLKPGGWFLLVEMYRDHLAETQITEKMIHHWSADIDTALGRLHNHTLSRQELLEMLQPDSWRDLQVYDVADLIHDPKDEKLLEDVRKTLEQVLEKASPLPDYAAHKKKAEALHQRLEEVGVHISTRLVVLAKK